MGQALRALVVYDSAYGNTERIAHAIAEGLGGTPIAQAIRVTDVAPSHLAGLTLLVVGSPTQRFRALPAVTAWLDALPRGQLKGVHVAAFDTRMTEKAVTEVRVLSFFVRIFGYAADPIADRLQKKGGSLIVPPAGFYVADTEGPLLDGELERAVDWGRQLAAAAA